MAHTQGSNSYSTTIMSLPSVTGNTSIPDMTRTKMEVGYWVLMCISMERKDLSGGQLSHYQVSLGIENGMEIEVWGSFSQAVALWRM